MVDESGGLADFKPGARITDSTVEPLDARPIGSDECPLCREFTFIWHRHHIVYRSQGGDDVPENLIWLCGPCHELIHNRRGGRRMHGRFLRYCRQTVPELGAYADAKKYPGWLERRYA